MLCCIALQNLLLNKQIREELLNFDEADDAEVDLGENNDLMQPTLQSSTRREQLHTFMVECTGQM